MINKILKQLLILTISLGFIEVGLGLIIHYWATIKDPMVRLSEIGCVTLWAAVGLTLILSLRNS